MGDDRVRILSGGLPRAVVVGQGLHGDRTGIVGLGAGGVAFVLHVQHGSGVEGDDLGVAAVRAAASGGVTEQARGIHVDFGGFHGPIPMGGAQRTQAIQPADQLTLAVGIFTFTAGGRGRGRGAGRGGDVDIQALQIVGGRHTVAAGQNELRQGVGIFRNKKVAQGHPGSALSGNDQICTGAGKRGPRRVKRKFQQLTRRERNLAHTGFGNAQNMARKLSPRFLRCVTWHGIPLSL